MKLKDLFEEFYNSFKLQRSGEFVEVFKNPSNNEIKEVEGNVDYVRGFLVGKDLLIWNVFIALHMDIHENFRLDKNVIPIILYADSSIVEVSDFSKYTNWNHNPKVKEAILNHPWVKRNLKDTEVHYYDEAIEGDWSELLEFNAIGGNRPTPVANIKVSPPLPDELCKDRTYCERKKKKKKFRYEIKKSI